MQPHIRHIQHTVTVMQSSVVPVLCAILAIGACQPQELLQRQFNNAIGESGNILQQLQSSVDTSRVGDQAQQEISQALNTVNTNVAGGVNGLLQLLDSYRLYGGSNLADIYHFIQNCPIRRAALNTVRDMWGQGTGIMGQLMGRGANMANGAIKWGGNALNGMTEAAGRAAETGLEVAYKVVDTAMTVEKNKLQMVSNALQVIRNELQKGGSMMKEFADTFQVTLKGVELTMNQSLDDARATIAKVLSDGVKVLEDGSLQFQSEVHKYFYNVVIDYQNWLEKIRKNLQAINTNIESIEGTKVDINTDLLNTSNLKVGSVGELASNTVSSLSDYSNSVSDGASRINDHFSAATDSTSNMFGNAINHAQEYSSGLVDKASQTVEDVSIPAE